MSSLYYDGPDQILKHHGRRFRRKPAMSASPLRVDPAPPTLNSSYLSVKPGASSKLSPPLPTHSNVSNPPHLGHPIILPPPQQIRLKLTKHGRPISAKGRVRPQSSVKPAATNQFREEFALQHFHPLPPIEASESPPLPSASTGLYEVDSAVDLTYNSQSNTPLALSLPPSPSSMCSDSPSKRNRVASDTQLSSASAADISVLAACRDDSPKLIHKHSPLLPQKWSPVPVLRQRTKEGRQPVSAVGDSTSSNPNNSESETRNKISPLASRASSNTVTPRATVEIGLKLPSGIRFQKTFDTASTIRQVVFHAQKESKEDLSFCEVCTNDVPRNVLTNWDQTLKEAGLTVRTMLYFSLP